jgi:hypothetical protein
LFARVGEQEEAIGSRFLLALASSDDDSDDDTRRRSFFFFLDVDRDDDNVRGFFETEGRDGEGAGVIALDERLLNDNNQPLVMNTNGLNIISTLLVLVNNE